MSELTKLTISAARDALRKGEVTSAQLTEACLTAIDGADALNAFVHKTPEIAMAQAKAAELEAETKPRAKAAPAAESET